MIRSTSTALLCLLTGAVLSFTSAQAVDTDPADMIMIAYQLTAEEEAQFSRTDGKVSDFWATWETNKLDYIHMDPVANETWMKPGENAEGMPYHEMFAAGVDDAQLHVKTAWGEKGLYFFFEATDDNFSDVVLTDSKGRTEFQGTPGDRTAEQSNDAIELRLCHAGTEEMSANPEQYFPTKDDGSIKNANSHTMAQYGIRFGGDLPDPDVEIFRRNPSYDHTSTDTADYSKSREYLWERPNIDDAAPDMGIDIEIVKTGDITRVQEWRIAWDQVGMAGAFTKPTEGKKIGMTIGYHDVDAGYEAERSDRFTWSGRFTHQPYPGSLNAWGDIYFGGPLATAKPIPVLPRNNLIARRQSREATGRYSLTGRTMTDNRATGMVLERITGDAGRRLVRF